MFKKREFKGEDTLAYSQKIQQELDSRLRGVEHLINGTGTTYLRALLDNEATAIGVAMRILNDDKGMVLPSQFVEKCNNEVAMYTELSERAYKLWEEFTGETHYRATSLWNISVARELYGIVTDVCIGL